MSEISLSYTPPVLYSIYLSIIYCSCEGFVDRGWCFARILIHHWFLFITSKSLHPNVCDRRHDLVNRCINSVSQMITDMLLICSHNSVLLPSSVPHYQMFNKRYTTVTTSGAETAYPSRIPNFMRGFLIGSSCLNLRFPSSISVSNVILFCPFLRANALSVLWFSVPVCPIDVFKLFVCTTHFWKNLYQVC